jgi:starch-binding outer membrane protein, SusD/RagB family
MIWIVLVSLHCESCTKLVTVSSPDNALTSENIYTSDATAASVLTGIYATLNANTPLVGPSLNGVSLLCGLSADELTLYGGSTNASTLLVQYYQNLLTSGAAGSPSVTIWSQCYSLLYTVNIALERLAVSNSLTPAVKQQLTGEAKFLRAFFYFYLVNLYGDVPLSITSDYTVNAALSRNTQAQIYQQIIADLKDAQNLLGNNYVSSDAMTTTSERLRPNKWVATAMLARTYLYTQQWDNAEAQASLIINNSGLFSLDSLNAVFLKNSTEAIWQWQPVNTGWNTEDARIFIIPPSGPTVSFPGSGNPVYISQDLLSAFEPGDERRLNWIDSVTVNGSTFYYPFKYKSATLNSSVTEYLMVFRLAEQYLIRAEARANQNNIGGAQSDLNAIRARAALANTSANDKNSLIAAILHERQIELFTEWGHRWLDLKRTSNVDAVMTNVAPGKGTTWSTNWQWFPISLYDITQDPNLVQNQGY